MKTTAWKNRWIVLLLTLLGFPGCNEPDQCMYGPAFAGFQIKGRVADPEGNPIRGISVQNTSSGRTTATDEEGHYAVFFGQNSAGYTLLFTDPGGEFADKEVEGRFTDGDRDSDGYDYVKTLDVTLEPKAPAGQ